MNDADNFGIFDVNTIANDDPTILPSLDAGVGAVYERKEDKWLPVTDCSPLD